MRLFALALFEQLRSRDAGPHTLSSLWRVVVRIHSPAVDEIVHRGSDGIRLLDDHEMPGAGDIDRLHSPA
jgi:hypothetical protein